MIRYSEQLIDTDDMDGVAEVLQSKFLTQGPLINEFENRLADLTRSKYAACVSSATAALHLTYLAAGMTKGSLVWTVANTFVATASAAVHCGATVDFVDIELKNYSICIEQFKFKLLEAPRAPDFLIVVHFAGRAVDLKEIAPLCKQYGIKIIEDASHALGAECNSRMVGQCEYSLACIFSFHPVKTITTAEGGAVTSNDEKLISEIKMLRNHSIEADHRIPWYKDQTRVGFNYRMSELQASLGISQLKKLSKFMKIRKDKASIYFSELANVDIKLPSSDSNYSISSWHLFILRSNVINEETRNQNMFKMLKENIGVNLHYFPLYRLNSFKRDLHNFTNNEDYFKSAFSIPLNLKMSEEEQNKVIKSIKCIFD